MLLGSNWSKPLAVLDSAARPRSSVIRVSAVGAIALTVTPYRASSWLVMTVKA